MRVLYRCSVTCMIVSIALLGAISSLPAHAQPCQTDELAKLRADDGASEDIFGCAVPLDRDTAAIGASSTDHRTSSAYVFERDLDAWVQVPKLTPADGQVNDEFGHPAVISGDTIMIGANTDDNENGDEHWLEMRSGGRGFAHGTWNDARFVDAAGLGYVVEQIGRGGQPECWYFNDFEVPGDPLAEWSTSSVTTAPSGERFLGEFFNDTVTLTLTDLATHAAVTIWVDLYIIRSWDGNLSADIWQFDVDNGPLLLRTTFDNNDHNSPPHFQSYPEWYPMDGSPPPEYPPRTGAYAVNTLGYSFDSRPEDTTYRLTHTFVHSSSTLTLHFTASQLEPTIYDESWGLDNVCVALGESVATTGLVGMVFDVVTGQPISDAEVTVPGEPPAQTGPDGSFSFSDLMPIEITITATKVGYYDAARTLTLQPGSNHIDIGMTASGAAGFGVAEVHGEYCGPGRRTYYLDGVSLSEEFTATVDWEGQTPGVVQWITPYKVYEDDCPGQTVPHSFNMGADFGEGGTLTVVAVTGDDPPVESEPYVVNMKVVPVPLGLTSYDLTPVAGGNALHYTTDGGLTDMILEAGVGAGLISEDVPLFGDEEFMLRASFGADGGIGGDGSGWLAVFEITGAGAVPTEIAGFEFGLDVGGGFSWEYVGDDWIPGGYVELGASVGADVPPFPVYFPLGPCPLCVPAYWRGHIDLGLDDRLEVGAWNAPGEPIWSNTLSLDPFPYAEAVLGVGAADVVAIESYVGGGARMTLQYPDEPPLEGLEVFLAGGARLVLFIVDFEWPLLECTYDFVSGEGGCDWGPRGEPPVMRLIPRDYLKRGQGYAVFVANKHRGGGVRDAVTEEIPIQLNVFGQSTPDLAASGNDLILSWIYDDPNRTPTNRTEVVFSAYDPNAPDPNEPWSEPAAVADDGTADFHPQIATLPGGDALLVWENVGEVLDEPVDPNDPKEVLAKLEEMKSKTEIAVTRYDGASGDWLAQTILTSNTILDRSPRIATADDGTAMLTWVSNATDYEIGDVENPNVIHYATYDGATWSTPADVALNVPSIVKSAMAYKIGEAILLFVGDTDGDTETPDDRELFGIQYDGSAWGAVMQLPSDPNGLVEDANPRVAYDAYGDPVIVWYYGGDIVFATDLLLADQQDAVDLDGPSSGAADFRLATGSAGQIALVWQNASDDVVDTWYAIYMPVISDWTQPRRLTADNSMEHAFAPTFDAGGDLWAAYNKVQVAYETRHVEVGGEFVEIDNVPVLDQSDLYALRHTVSGDLGIFAADITLSPENPLPWTPATIAAVVHNLGDTPAENIDVAVFDGDPDDPNTLIGTTALAGLLAGSDQGEISVDWLVPPSTEPRELFVVVDPNGVQEDRDRENNVASMTVLAPDLTISEIGVQAAGPDRLLTIRVANEGVLTVTDVGLTLHRDGPDGPVLETFTVSEILPGAYHDVPYRWESPPPHVEGQWTVCAVVDESEAIAEFNEQNNTRSALVSVGTCVGDLDGDLDVDLADLAQLLSNYGSTSGATYGDGDLDGDRDVDLSDLAALLGVYGTACD